MKKMYRFHVLRYAAAVLCLITAGCTSARGPVAGAGGGGHAAAVSFSDPAHVVEPVLRREVQQWLGTPHVLGGTTAAGMDCSAFVQRVFSDAFDVRLPRTTEQQVKEGSRVNMSELRPGDLVFFQPPTKTNHVGIYLDDGEFAHVSTSSGVMISELSLPYWTTAYWTSRRILADADVRPIAADARAAPPEDGRVGAIRPVDEAGGSERASTTPRRIGW